MGGVHQVDVVDALVDQFRVDFSQTLDGDLLAVVFMGDVVVLAEAAAQVAVGEKDRSRACSDAGTVIIAPVM